MKHLPILVGVALLAAGCGTPEAPTRTIAEFTEDPTLLQGVMIRCAEQRTKRVRDPECANALAAADRLAADEDMQRRQERTVAFERQREERRAREEAQRQAADRAEPRFDPYSAPVSTDVPPASASPGPATKP